MAFEIQVPLEAFVNKMKTRYKELRVYWKEKDTRIDKEEDTVGNCE